GFLTNAQGCVFFRANDGSAGYELWQTDGTAAGTFLVKDINPGTPDALPNHLTNLSGQVYFAADDGQHGNELWLDSRAPTTTSLNAAPNPSGTGQAVTFT